MCSMTHIVNKPKILLADTRYDTVGAHSNYVPIGIGYIGAYLKEKLKDYDIDLKLSTKPEEVFDLIDRAILWLKKNNYSIIIKKWETKLWGEIPADFGRK